MDVSFTPEQELLRSAVRDVLDEQCPTSLVREVAEAGSQAVGGQRLWTRIAELGWMGLALDEAHGGSGLGMIDVAIVAEEMGRALLPVPWFTTVALFAEAIRAAGSREQRDRWLPQVAAGQLRGTVALLEPDAIRRSEHGPMTATANNGGYVLGGAAAFVPELGAADLVVVVARLEGQPSLFVVDRARLQTVDEPTLDSTRRLGTAVIDSVAVDSDRLLGGEPCSWPVVEKVTDRATAILAAEMCGGAQKVLDLAVEYARQRTQFGRPIGSFQGVSHRCADMLLAIESARSLAYYAAWCCDNDEPAAPLAVSAAKAWAGDTYRSATAQAIQIHGGLGFTWEADLHLWYRRAFWSASVLGDPVDHRERVATLIGL